MNDQLILATRNAHKLAEVGRMLAPYGLTVAPLPDSVLLPPEDGETFAENARGKALAAATALRRAVIADDSGIEAAALGGRPGVRSARYAGPREDATENLAKLIVEVPPGSVLRYVCVLAYADGAGETRCFEGTCSGVMAPAPAGAGGFGYDPVFIADEIDQDVAPSGGRRTLAQCSAAEKDLISHRGRAVRAFAQWLTRRQQS